MFLTMYFLKTEHIRLAPCKSEQPLQGMELQEEK